MNLRGLLKLLLSYSVIKLIPSNLNLFKKPIYDISTQN